MADPSRQGCPSPQAKPVPIVALDANVLERVVSAADEDAKTFRAAVEAERLRVFVPSGVAREIRHPNTPGSVRAALLSRWESRLHTGTSTSLSARQHIDRIRVRAVMRGDGRPGKHDADAGHLSETAEAGCSHFITQDGKILRKRDTLRDALPPGLSIVTLDVFLSDLDRDG